MRISHYQMCHILGLATNQIVHVTILDVLFECIPRWASQFSMDHLSANPGKMGPWGDPRSYQLNALGIHVD